MAAMLTQAVTQRSFAIAQLYHGRLLQSRCNLFGSFYTDALRASCGRQWRGHGQSDGAL